MQNSAAAQEYSIIGVMLLLFGITFVTYAARQPIVEFQGPGVCGSSPTGGIPPCTSLSITADVFYVLGIGAVSIGAVLLLLRFNLARKGRGNATGVTRDHPVVTSVRLYIPCLCLGVAAAEAASACFDVGPESEGALLPLAAMRSKLRKPTLLSAFMS